MYVLWLDDYRNPFEDNWAIFIQNKQLEVKWAKSYNEFVECIETYGFPVEVCFDHDLADSHYTPEHLWDDYEKSKEWQETQIHQEKTGYDCAKWLVDYCMDNNLKLPIYSSHSANPVGRDNILNLLKSYDTFNR